MNSELASNFRKTEVGVIPEDWIVNELGNLTVFVTDGKHGDCQNQANSGYYFLSAKDVNGGRLDYSNAREITKEDFLDTHKRTKLEARNVLLTNSGTIGRLAMAEDTEITKRTTFQKSVAVIKPKALLDSYFLYYYLVANTRRVQETSGGTTQKNLLLKDLRTFKIAIPSLNVQKAQTSLLISIDSKIESNLKMNATLEAIGQAVFRRWFVDFEFPNEDGKPYKSSSGEMVYNETLGSEIPEGWQVNTLDEISFNFDSKRVPLSSREREKMQGNYPYYGATGIFDYVNDFIFDGTYTLMGEDGTVIDEKGFPVLQLVRGKFWVNNHAHILQGRGISTELLFLFLKNTNVQHIVTGAVQPKINQGNMNTLKFVIPDEPCKNKLQIFVDLLYTKIGANDEQIQTLIQLRDLLLPKLMSGNIRVPIDNKMERQ